MAHSSASKSGDTTQSPERGSRIEGKVSPAMATNVEREPEKREEQFLASDSFYSRMEAMIKKGDVEAILEKQKETQISELKPPTEGSYQDVDRDEKRFGFNLQKNKNIKD